MASTIGVRLALIAAIIATIGCDRATKYMATTTLMGSPGRSFLSGAIRLEYAENAGGFLSLGADLPKPVRTGLFTISTGLALLALVAGMICRGVGGWPLLGLGVFVAGGVSNWLDRVTRGSVVDFITVDFGPVRTGIFNVADVAIMLGAAVVLLAARGSNRPTHAETPDDRTVQK